MNLMKSLATAEAAYVANLSDRELNRVVDEHLLPPDFFSNTGGARQFTTAGLILSKFYFQSASDLSAAARKAIIGELAQRLRSGSEDFDVDSPDCWRSSRGLLQIDISPVTQTILARMSEIAQLEEMIHKDPDVMSGRPVFKGTRVPIDLVLEAHQAGDSLQDLQEAYPFLGGQHLAAAQTYQRLHPNRGRPRRLLQVNPNLVQAQTT